MDELEVDGCQVQHLAEETRRPQKRSGASIRTLVACCPLLAMPTTNASACIAGY
jgi:hypothetical protein